MEEGKDQEFYSTLDNSAAKRGKKNSCSCLALGIFFLVVLVILELGLFFIARGFRANEKNSNSVTPSGELEMKGSGIDLGDNRFALTISQGILCNAIANTSGIKNLNCAITADGIELSGKISSYLPSNAKVILIPTQQNGKVVFQIKRLSVGFIPVPSFLAKSISNSMGLALYTTFPDLEKAQVDKVELQEAVMTITAKKV